ncbi:MAG: hypothetical protein JW782_01140 [Candidatus Saganbacteria bacterium]|nr:hypothetical protein [Candidatus Saganbacteria bacterium]
MSETSRKIKYINKVKLPVVRPCPCAVGHRSCGYIIISHILGCLYNCSYCFLHTYYGKDEIVVLDNEPEILRQLKEHMAETDQPLRYGTGQYSDSLALPEAQAMAKTLVKLFARQDKHIFEIKTKSAAVDDLLTLDHKGKTVVAWSVNPQKIAEREELGAGSLGSRIAAAKKCIAAGYPVGFHFDPIIHYDGWEKDYAEVVDMIFETVPADKIAWISLGALRFPPELKRIISDKFPGSRLMDHEFEQAEDGKLRYALPVRLELFNTLYQLIRQRSNTVLVYLCMETSALWQLTGLMLTGPYTKYFGLHLKK